MRTIFRKLRDWRFRYEPLVTVRVFGGRILHNVGEFRKLNPGIGIAPVLKSNAYGHGLVQVAKILASEDIPFLCVDSYFEAMILRNEGIRTPILIVGFTPAENMVRSRLKDVSFAVMSRTELDGLVRQAKRNIKIHLKIDTGMHRHGLLPNEVHDALRAIETNRKIKLDGVYSHFADADTENSKHAALQIERWNGAAKLIKASMPGISYFHMGGTAGHHFVGKLEAVNVMRLGIGLYGYNVSLSKSLDLRPAMEVATRITSIREIEAGESVGYNATFTADKPMRIASIPMGYTEGIDRRLSGKGFVGVRGVACPIVGRVSMNITSIDVSGVPKATMGDEVIVISKNPSDKNSVENIAETCGTIPYEILVHISPNLRREVVSGE